jgi:uncharacterized protein (TIGR00730 family)
VRRICVFCGANSGNRPAFRAAARGFGRMLAERGIELVYGGGNVGLMGEIADAALEAGGYAIGVIPRALLEKELGHRDVQELIVVTTMHERKAKMAELADAFVALPGGFGTLDELCEVLTWTQLGFHQKPCGVLDVEGYFRPLSELFDRAVECGFLRAENRAIVLEESDPERLLARLASWRPEPAPKWIERKDV